MRTILSCVTVLVFTPLALLRADAITSQGPEVTVHNGSDLKAALRKLTSGTTLKIAAGDYSGGNQVQSMEQLTIEALDPENPPHFKGGNNAWQF